MQILTNVKFQNHGKNLLTHNKILQTHATYSTHPTHAI